MNKNYFCQERDFYQDQLLNNILPFWLKYGRDEECGGYHTCLNRDGSVFDYDKICTWGQGRIICTFAYLYNEFKREPQWLDMAMHGVDFMLKFGFDESGRVYYSLSRKGTPLAKTRDIFAELSLAAGFAECFKATGDRKLLQLAKKCVFMVAEVVKNPRTNTHRRFMSQSRPMSLNAEHMIILNTIQRLRELDDDPQYEKISLYCLENIFNLHYNKQKRCVFEAVSIDGSPLPGQMGRWINPGHMIELSWFLIHEGQYRDNMEIIGKGLKVIDWGMEWGWDEDYGGIINDVDIEGKFLLGPQFLYAPMKMWWSVLEALYGNALAYSMTGDQKFMDYYKKVRQWSFDHLADGEYGEWYGYLSPEGKIIDAGAKGTDIKSCYHIGRAFYLCHKIFARLAAG